MSAYVFRIVVERDEDRWIAYCPALDKYAAATWGYTKEEARRHIYEVVELVLQEIVEDNEQVPGDLVELGDPEELQVAITI